MNVLYPEESFFYPEHFLIGIITSLVFLVILLISRIFLKGKTYQTEQQVYTIEYGALKYSVPKEQLNILAFVSFLVGTILFSGILPFIQSPLLDYSARVDGKTDDNHKVFVEIRNNGLKPAKKIFVSLNVKPVNASKITPTVKFNNDFSIYPYLGKRFTVDNKSSTEAITFEIDSIPPFSEVNITGTVFEPNGSERNLVPFVWSEEGHGNFGTQLTLYYYAVLAVVYSIIFAYLAFGVRFPRRRYRWKALGIRTKGYVLSYIVLILIGQFVFVQLYLFLYPGGPEVIFGLNKIYVPILVGFEVMAASLVPLRGILKSDGLRYVFAYLLIGQFVFVQLYLFLYPGGPEVIFGLNKIYFPILILLDIVAAFILTVYYLEINRKC